MTMKTYKNRLDRLAQRLPAGDDDEIVIIRLSWGGVEDPDFPPITLRRGVGGKLIKKVGFDTVPAHLRGATVNAVWNDYEIDAV